MRCLAIFLTIYMLAVFVRPAEAQEKIALKVDIVVDGDTFVAQKARIRVWGIGQPPFWSPGFKLQFGRCGGMKEGAGA